MKISLQQILRETKQKKCKNNWEENIYIKESQLENKGKQLLKKAHEYIFKKINKKQTIQLQVVKNNIEMQQMFQNTKINKAKKETQQIEIIMKKKSKREWEVLISPPSLWIIRHNTFKWEIKIVLNF